MVREAASAAPDHGLMPNLSRWRIEQIDRGRWTLLMAMPALSDTESAEEALVRARAMLAPANIAKGRLRAKEYRSWPNWIG